MFNQGDYFDFFNFGIIITVFIISIIFMVYIGLKMYVLYSDPDSIFDKMTIEDKFEGSRKEEFILIQKIKYFFLMIITLIVAVVSYTFVLNQA